MQKAYLSSCVDTQVLFCDLYSVDDSKDIDLRFVFATTVLGSLGEGKKKETKAGNQIIKLLNIKIHRLFVDGLNRFARVVSQNDIGAGAFDARERFEHYALFVDPAFLGRGFDQRILT